MACIINYEAHIMKLGKSFTQLELGLLAEIQTKKTHLRIMDDIDIYSNTKSELDEIEEKEFPFINDWYIINIINKCNLFIIIKLIDIFLGKLVLRTFIVKVQRIKNVIFILIISNKLKLHQIQNIGPLMMYISIYQMMYIVTILEKCFMLE